MGKWLHLCIVALVVTLGCDKRNPVGPGLVENRQVVDTPPPRNAPVITIASPKDSSNVPQGSTVAVAGTARDPEDGDISANIVWSTTPGGVIGRGPSVPWDAKTIGAHTVTAQVGDSSGLVATATVSINITHPSAPKVAITAPAPGATVVRRTAVSFVATATDADGKVISDNVSWKSSLDGDFGSGSVVTFAPVTVGAHSITATVNDRGLSGSASVVLTVTPTPPISFSTIRYVTPDSVTLPPGAPSDMTLTFRLLVTASADDPVMLAADVPTVDALADPTPRYRVTGFYNSRTPGARGTIDGEVVGLPNEGQFTGTFTALGSTTSCAQQVAQFSGVTTATSAQFRRVRTVTDPACSVPFPYDDFSGNATVGTTPPTGPAPPSSTIPTPTSCTFSVTPQSPSHSASAGTHSVTLSAATGCAWSAQTFSDWITIQPPYGGTIPSGGSSTVSYAVMANAGNSRSGQIRVAESMLLVQQAAAAPSVAATTVSFEGAGPGSRVSSDPSGISCVSGETPSRCSAPFPVGASVILAATPAEGWLFTGWTRGPAGCLKSTSPCRYVVGAALTEIVASFARANFRTTISAASGSGRGRIESTPRGIDCTIDDGGTSNTCTALFPFGTTVLLTVTVGEGSFFSQWTKPFGGCEGDYPSCQYSAPAMAIELQARIVSGEDF